MKKKRSLIDAARDTVREKKRLERVHQLTPRANIDAVRKKGSNEQVQAASPQTKSFRNLVLASIAIAVGFVGGVLVSRYLRIF